MHRNLRCHETKSLSRLKKKKALSELFDYVFVCDSFIVLQPKSDLEPNALDDVSISRNIGLNVFGLNFVLLGLS